MDTTSMMASSVKNQIDYIITEQIHKTLITNARSYDWFSTTTDHKLGITNIKFRWVHQSFSPQSKKKLLNIQNLSYKTKNQMQRSTERKDIVLEEDVNLQNM